MAYDQCNRCYEETTNPIWLARLVTAYRNDRPCERHRDRFENEFERLRRDVDCGQLEEIAKRKPEQVAPTIGDDTITASPNPTAEETLARVEEFLAGVHGLNEMNVVRGLRKVIAGDESTFIHEVRLSVYGAPCGHKPPKHYPAGYGACQPCRYPNLYNEEDYDDESRW